MIYLVGVYHPKPGKYSLPPGYDLTRDQLQAISIQNIPLTIEHSGIFQAVKDVDHAGAGIDGKRIGDALDRIAEQDALKAPVGVVVEGRESEIDGRWYCLAGLDLETYSDIPFLVNVGALKGLSLTHVEASSLVAVEISLCHHPARPECFVYKVCPTYVEAQKYMRACCSKADLRTSPAGNMSNETATDASPSLTFNEAIDAMDDSTRNIVAAKFDQMVKAVEAAQKNQAQANKLKDEAEKRASDLQKTKSAQDANYQLLKQQLGIMGQRFNKDILDNYSCTPEQLVDEFKSSDEAVLKSGLQRVIMACNHQLMIANARNLDVDKEQSRKRRATEQIQPEPASDLKITAASAQVATPAAASTDPRDILRHAVQRLDDEFVMM
jgi:hypothetical protein